MKKESESLFSRKSVGITILLLCISATIVLFPMITEKNQLSELDFNFESLLPEGVTEQEWLDSIIIYYEGYEDGETGFDYYERSKMYALDAAKEFGQSETIEYLGNSKVFRNYEQFAPLIFEWQCEFDAVNDGFYLYIAGNYSDKWKAFLKSKLEVESDYRLIDEAYFDTIFARTYWFWGDGILEVFEK